MAHNYDMSCNCGMTFVLGGVSLSLDAVLNLSLSFPQSYFLSQAQSLCSAERSAIPDSLRWLCHPLGQKFFVERSWTVKSAAKESLYCTQRNPGESRLCPECVASQHFEPGGLSTFGTQGGVLFESALVVVLVSQRDHGAERCLLSLQELALSLLYNCAVTSCRCLYMLEHSLNVALNVWEVTVG